MTRKKITLKNDFHTSEASAYAIRLDDIHYMISKTQYNRLKVNLCGSKDCTCGGPFCDRKFYDAVRTETFDGELIFDIEVLEGKE